MDAVQTLIQAVLGIRDELLGLFRVFGELDGLVDHGVHEVVVSLPDALLKFA